MISKKDFTEQVEKLLRNGKAGVMDAICRVCELNNIEPESTKRLLSDPLREKLEAEAQSLKLINRGKGSQGTITSFFSN